ncbi:hypothetical protein ABPG74_012393 [Tetrahymena malaccensis]
MIESQKLVVKLNQINSQIVKTFDYVVYSLNKLASKFGDDGYLLYGFLSSTGIFIGMTSLKFIPSVDWSICFILRGVAYYLFGIIFAAIYKSDITFAGNSFYYTNLRNILMGFYQLFLQYVMVLLPVSIIWIIINSTPIFVFIVNYFMFSIPISGNQILLLLLSLFGVSLIMDPEIFQHLFNALIKKDNQVEEGQIKDQGFQITLKHVLSALLLLSQCVCAYAVCVIKKASKVNSLSITLHLGFVFITIGSIALFYRSEFINIPSLQDLFLVFLFYGFGTFLPSILFIQGTLIAKCQGKYSLTTYTNVFYAFIFQILFQNKNPSIFEFIGVIITFYGLYKLMVK